MRNPGLRLILLLALICPWPPARAEEPLSLATLEWAPYVGKDLPDRGFATEIVTEVLGRSGYGVDITFMPWVRVLRRVARGEADALYPACMSSGPGCPCPLRRKGGAEVEICLPAVPPQPG